MATQVLTDEEVGLILLGLAALNEKNKQTLGRADKEATDAAAYDAALDVILRERKMVEELSELLDTAEQIDVHVRD